MLQTRRPVGLLLCGLAAGTTVLVASCSSSSNASISSTGQASGSTPSMSMTASAPALQHGVAQGATCAPATAEGVTTNGVAMVCQKDSSGQNKWTSAVSDAARAKPGLFCAHNGQTTTTTTASGQVKLVCRAGSDGRLRWSNATS